MTEASRDGAIRSRLAAQWAVFFARSRRSYAYRPKTFTLPSRRRFTPDFHVEDLGWVTVCKERSIFRHPGARSARANPPLLPSFERFFEFASDCDEWCYWLGGSIPFHTPREAREIVSYSMDDLEDPARFHRAERLHEEEWLQSFRWYKLRRHGGPRRLPRLASQCGAVLTRLHGEQGEHFKDGVLDSEAFDAFNNKRALLAARSAHL